MAARKPQPEETFESLYAQLEEKARKLEQGNLPLEESLALYEDGAAIVERLRTVLEAAELRIRNVQGRTEQDDQFLREVAADDPGDWEE